MGRLKKIAEAKSIAIAYDLCRRVVTSIERQLNIQGLKVSWVPVTVQSRLRRGGQGTRRHGCEPYGIVLPRGDAALRLAVNTGLAQIFGGDEIVEIYRRWFGALGRSSAVLEAAYIQGTLPE